MCLSEDRLIFLYMRAERPLPSDMQPVPGDPGLTISTLRVFIESSLSSVQLRCLPCSFDAKQVWPGVPRSRQVCTRQQTISSR